MDYQGMYVSGHRTSSSSRLKEDPRLRKETPDIKLFKAQRGPQVKKGE